MNSSPQWMTALKAAAQRGLRALYKEPPLTAVEWADKHFYLSSESSYQEGKWVTAPAQRVILNCMGNDRIRVVNLVKSARVGYTKMLMANVGYKVQHKRRNVLSFCPTDPDAQELMERHVDTMLRDVPVLKALSPWLGRKHKHNKITSKRFDNAKMLWCLGGKAARNYREKSADEVIYDELSRFDADVEGEGAPTFIGDKRLEGATFPKSIRGSTPGLAGFCQIEKAGLESPHFLRCHLPCPHCGQMQALKWGGKDSPFGIKFERGPSGEPSKAWYLCEHHGCVIEYHESVIAMQQCRWVCDRTGINTVDGLEWYDKKGQPAETPRTVTLHIWTAYSQNTTWLDMCQEFNKVGSDREKLVSFVNTTLGEVWEEDQGERVDWEVLHARREVYPQVPNRAVVLTAGVDTQDDRYEIYVWAFGAGEEKWLVYRSILTGDPASKVLRRKVAKELRRQFVRGDGVVMGLERVCWDAGGHYSDEVHEESRRLGVHWVIPIFGASTYGKPIANFPTRRHKKHRTYMTEVGTDNAKELIYSRLKIQPSGDEPVPGCMHFPADDAICDESVLQQLTTERKKPVIVKGQRVLRWDSGNRRNEALDCLVYALTALRISQQRYGLDLDALNRELPNDLQTHDDSDPEEIPPPRRRKQKTEPAPAGDWIKIGDGPWL